MSMLKKMAWVGTALVALGVAGYGVRYAMAPAYDGGAGITYGKAYAPVRDDTVPFHIWYPAEPGGRAVTVGGNGVFHGTSAGRDAPHREGRFPMIIISHGAGGNAGQFGWIAAQLAAKGYVVVLPNHPGTTSGNASAEAAVRVWERPQDVTAVLDEITANPAAYPFIDTDRIATLGFSAGGFTAMALAGARLDVAALQGFCDGDDHGMSDCAFLRRGGVDLHAMDLSPAGEDMSDPRIDATIAIDPGIVETMTPESLSAIDMPVLVLNLGDEGTIPAGVHARAAAEAVPGADYVIVPDAIHFSFLAECTARGAKILEREGEPDPLCEDAGGRPRSAIHAEVAGLVTGFLAGLDW